MELMAGWLQHRGKRQVHGLMALSLFHNEVYTERLHNNQMIEKEEDHSRSDKNLPVDIGKGEQAALYHGCFFLSLS